MTRNHLLADIKYKVFRSGDPVYFYIGINTIVFVAVALFNVPYWLAGNTSIPFFEYVSGFFAFPASLQLLPSRFYTVLTYQFLHENIFHILFNMLWLFWIGRIFMDFQKARQFHFIYLGGGIAGALFFALAYNLLPVFAGSLYGATIVGSSASVMAIAVATTVLVPDYRMTLMLIGSLKLRYLVLAYILIDLVGIASVHAGESFAHLGGALFGFAYIKMLQQGKDWSSWLKRKPKLKVVKNEARSAAAPANQRADQREVDAILDKISASGYDKLSKSEKEILFRASKDR